LSDPDVVHDDVESDMHPTSEEERRRSWYGLLLVILLLLLLLCCAVTSADVFITHGPEQARFVARNLECLQCHTEMIPDFAKADVHSPFALKECTTCHTPHGGQITTIVTQGPGSTWRRIATLAQWLPLRWWYSIWGFFGGRTSATSTSIQTGNGTVVSSTTRGVVAGQSGLVMPEEQLCWTCHGDLGPLLGDAYQHQPFSAGHCTTCHDPHASDNRALLVEAPNRICFSCHPVGSWIDRAQVHPPAAQGWCVDCHNPHASNYKGILVAPQRELCFRCHPSVAVLADMPVQHPPFENNDCTGCHQPHGSDYTPLLNAPQPQLCYNCHPAIKDQFAQPSHHPIGLNLTCSSCHDPHAAQYQFLINAQDNSFCYQCHGDKQALYDASAHSQNLCIRCHTPHGSQYSPILVAPNPQLCLQCHTGLTGPNRHPVTPNFFDVHAQKGLTCTSTCHNPHGTSFDFMLRNFNFPQDGQCLQCHKWVGSYF